MLVNINFGGFYESIHDLIVERSVADFFGFVDKNGYEVDSEQTWYITKEIWDYAKTEYSKVYVSELNSIFDTDIKFVSLNSPSYYNYSTDVIIAEISRTDCLKLIKYLKADNLDLKPRLYELVKNRTTSRDGYMAFYNYEDFFSKESYSFLFECILDVLIERENESYPVIVEDFWIDIPKTKKDKDGYIIFDENSEVA